MATDRLERKVERHFKAGYVAIVGQPNVGKSTLLNNFLNFKLSSITRKPGTTRHQIRGILNGADHQIIFIDTPGLLEPRYKLQETMLQAALKAIKDADLIVYLVDATDDPLNLAFPTLMASATQSTPTIIAINKIDKVVKQSILPLIDMLRKSQRVKEIVPISALKSDGLTILRKEILQLLPLGVPLYDPEQITDHPERFFVAEIIREKIFERYGDEIPYSTTVQIDEFQERKNRKDWIRATVYVEKKSQKGILIGKKGYALKQLGSAARGDIERILDREIFLELWVKTKEKWRDNEVLLRELGYY